MAVWRRAKGCAVDTKAWIGSSNSGVIVRPWSSSGVTTMARSLSPVRTPAELSSKVPSVNVTVMSGTSMRTLPTSVGDRVVIDQGHVSYG